MTDIGYNYILSQITNREIFPPKGLTANELMRWLNGYQACQNDIVRILTAMKNENERS